MTRIRRTLAVAALTMSVAAPALAVAPAAEAAPARTGRYSASIKGTTTSGGQSQPATTYGYVVRSIDGGRAYSDDDLEYQSHRTRRGDALSLVTINAVFKTYKPGARALRYPANLSTGTTWKWKAKASDGATAVAKHKVVRTGSVRVDGRTVPTVRVVQKIRLRGSIEGTRKAVIDYARSVDLPLRVNVDQDITAFGTYRVQADFVWRITSLTPQDA